MGPIGCPETSVKDYHSALSNIPEERRSYKNIYINTYITNILTGKRVGLPENLCLIPDRHKNFLFFSVHFDPEPAQPPGWALFPGGQGKVA
jgi:hypothetical protein